LNFTEGSGIECVQGTPDALSTKIRRKYKNTASTKNPSSVVRRQRHYGMGIMTVRDAKDWRR